MAILEQIDKQAKMVCQEAVTRLRKEGSVVGGGGFVALKLELCSPSGREGLVLSQTLQNPYAPAFVEEIEVRSTVATDSLGGAFQPGFSITLKPTILMMDDGTAARNIVLNDQIFGHDGDIKVRALSEAIKNWPRCG